MASGKTSVYVLGAGIIGLSTAINIQEALPDVEVTIVADKIGKDRNLASYGSSAGWGTCISIFEGRNELLEKWARSSWNYLFDLVRSVDGAPAGLQLIPGYVVYYRKQHDLKDPWWLDLSIGYRRVPKAELDKMFPNFPEFKDAIAFTTISIDCGWYLQYMMDKFQRSGGRVEKRRLETLEEMVGTADVLVNCSGLAARFLCNDMKVRPMRGQVVRIEAPWQHFFVHDHVDKSTELRLFFVPRRNDVQCGVTQQLDRWDTENDQNDIKKLLEITYKTVPNLKAAKVLDAWAGLRPYRDDGPRVEKETMKFGSGSLQVVHNYGHGTAGATWHWGSALEATSLVVECVKMRDAAAKNQTSWSTKGVTPLSKI